MKSIACEFLSIIGTVGYGNPIQPSFQPIEILGFETHD
jgi:hypothetical protein